MSFYWITSVALLCLVIIFNQLSKKSLLYQNLFRSMTGYTALTFILLFIIMILETTLRYKIYLPSSYQLLVKEGDRTYQTKEYIPFILDRLTGEIYISLGKKDKTFTSYSDGDELNTLFLINNKEYNFRKGELRLNYNPHYVISSEKGHDFFYKKEKAVCDISLNFRGKTLSFHSSDQRQDLKLKEIPGNGTYYGYKFSALKSYFDLALSVQLDDDNGAIYLVRD